jgi:hypothetical protein
MEVLRHSHTARKKWHHYFWEFFYHILPYKNQNRSYMKGLNL